VNREVPPTLIVIGGPNGAGKSTFTVSLGSGAGVPVIDPDAVARRLQPLLAEEAAMSAGRSALIQQAAYLKQGTSFAVETTLAGTRALRLIDQARGRGYGVHLVYIGVENVQTALDRIVERVAHGGHAVPPQDVRRRYLRSLRNLTLAVARADHVLLLDNSTEGGMRAVLAVDDGQVTMRAENLPAWVTTYLPL